MMSIVVVLMLGCSAFVFPRTLSSHLKDIDTTYFMTSTRLLTDSLTLNMTDTAIVDTTKSQDTYSQDYSQFLALTLDYVSQTSKASCTSKELIAKTICDIALENDIDICFILAQGTIETHLGTTGIGKSRHSIFGVYRTYKDYDECINAYAKLLKKSYLTKGHTEKDLMQRYVTTGGARYAGDTLYEQRLTNTYKGICKSHGALLTLQRKLEGGKS